MVAQSSFVASGQATGDLTVNAGVGDIIRWRTLSLSGNTDACAIIYDIEKFGGTQVTGSPDAYVQEPYQPLPVVTDDNKVKLPPAFSVITVEDYFMQANISKHGTENYKVFFYVTNTNQTTGKPEIVGYFNWDPTIVAK